MKNSQNDIKANNQPIRKAADPAKDSSSTRLKSNGSVGVSGTSGASTTEDDF
jgi:hypothetical protein